MGESHNNENGVDDYDFYYCECRISIFDSSVTNLVLKDRADLQLEPSDVYAYQYPHHFEWYEGVYKQDGVMVWADSINLLLVTAVKANAFKGRTKLQHVRLPDTCRTIGTNAFNGCTALTSIELQEGLESIGDYAFYGCTALTNLVIPNSVTNIGINAFYGCTNLVSVSLGSGLKSIPYGMFKNCAKLKTLSLSEGLLDIGDYAFYGCNSLTNLVIPNSVTNIMGYFAFQECHGLLSITLGDGLRKIPSFDRTDLVSIALGNGITEIPPSAFREATHLTTLKMGNNVTNIGLQAFEHCSSLTNFAIPESITEIGSDAFAYCTSLTSVTIVSSDSSSSIGAFAFEGCTNLATATIGVTTIEQGAFAFCTGLTTLKMLPNVSRIEYNAFNGCTGLMDVHVQDLAAWCKMDINDRGHPLIYARRLFVNGVEVSDLIISEGITSITRYAFYKFRGLTSVTIPDSVTEIGDMAFYGCSGLTSVTIGNSVADIGANAFANCSGLTSLVLPEGVATIEGYAFSRTGLTNIVLPNSLTSLGANPFTGCTNLESIGVAAGNPAFISRDGVLFSADGKQLLVYPPGRKAEAYAIPEGVETLEGTVFRGCGNLVSLSLPASMCDPEYSSWKCPGLMEILVADGNACYSARDGILYDKAGQTLLLCPEKKAGRSYTIPAGTTTIGSYAFYGYTNLEQVVIPEGVTNIEMGAFYMSGLTSVATPKSVTSIGHYAFSAYDLAEATIAAGEVGACFSDCSALKHVTFGTGVTSIDIYAFSWSGVKTVYAPISWKGITNPLSQTFYDQSYPRNSEHTFEIVYYEPETPGGDATSTTPVSVPHAWLQESATDILAANGGDYEAAAKAVAANGRTVWECYVAGVGTTEKEAEFKVKSVSVVAGELQVEWEPDLDAERSYTVEGKRSMEDEWGEKDADSRFFRVRVEMP